MAMIGYLSVDGIKGSARPSHASGKSTVFAVAHEAEAGVDGKARHRPFVVSKEIDAASPGLHKALSTGGAIARVAVDFWRMPPAGGKEENYYSVTMSKAKVTSIRTVMSNSTAADTAQAPDFEEVGFSYESISWNFKGKADAGGASSESETQVNPAPDKLEDLARKIVVDAAKEVGDTIRKAIRSAAADIAKGGAKPAEVAPTP